MRALPLLAALSALALSAACSKTVDAPAELIPSQPTGGTPIMLPDPDLQNGHVGRAPRRITVAQLKASIQVTTGRQWSQIDNLAQSLGQADYALVNSENTEPNLVFAKFLEDGAREVCINTARADLAAGMTPATRVLARELPQDLSNLNALSEAAVRANLEYLSLRFWGQPLRGAELDAWTGFFKQAAARAQTIARREQAFAATCIALMTDPRFLTY
jgi:hypothetical protein